MFTNTLWKTLKTRACSINPHILLPEGFDPRVIQAAKWAKEHKIARVEVWEEDDGTNLKRAV